MRLARTILALSLAALTPLAAGCDFFKSSGPEGGVSPFVSDMRISRSSTTCDRDFVISFQYRDPQDDIDFMRVTFQHETGYTFELDVVFQSNGGLVPPDEDIEIDPDAEDIFGGSLDLSVEGRAQYTYHFQCGLGYPTGEYLVTVQLFDRNDHGSNTRSEKITLTSN